MRSGRFSVCAMYDSREKQKRRENEWENEKERAMNDIVCFWVFEEKGTERVLRCLYVVRIIPPGPTLFARVKPQLFLLFQL